MDLDMAHGDSGEVRIVGGERTEGERERTEMKWRGYPNDPEKCVGSSSSSSNRSMLAGTVLGPKKRERPAGENLEDRVRASHPSSRTQELATTYTTCTLTESIEAIVWAPPVVRLNPRYNHMHTKSIFRHLPKKMVYSPHARVCKSHCSNQMARAHSLLSPAASSSHSSPFTAPTAFCQVILQPTVELKLIIIQLFSHRSFSKVYVYVTRSSTLLFLICGQELED